MCCEAAPSRWFLLCLLNAFDTKGDRGRLRVQMKVASTSYLESERQEWRWGLLYIYIYWANALTSSQACQKSVWSEFAVRGGDLLVSCCLDGDSVSRIWAVQLSINFLLSRWNKVTTQTGQSPLNRLVLAKSP